MILDTHAWLFYATGKRLEKPAIRRIDRARVEGRLRIAAVTLWEVALLVHEKRLRFSQPTAEWFRDALEHTGVRVEPLDVGTSIHAARLIHALRDPADCQIVGTALHVGVPLATRDARIIKNAEALGLDILEI